MDNSGQNRFEFLWPSVKININQAFLRKNLMKIELNLSNFLNIFNEFYPEIHKNSLLTRSVHFFLTPDLSRPHDLFNLSFTCSDLLAITTQTTFSLCQCRATIHVSFVLTLKTKINFFNISQCLFYEKSLLLSTPFCYLQIQLISIWKFFAISCFKWKLYIICFYLIRFIRSDSRPNKWNFIFLIISWKF